MSGRLRAIAQETVAIVEAGRYRTSDGPTVKIGAAISRAVAGTVLHGPDDELPAPEPGPAPKISVTNETTLSAAHRLGGGSGDVACLNFASARNPGGGFLRGAQAQEESIARASALAACLEAAFTFYAAHRANADLRYTDRVIHSPRVPVFRDDQDALLAEPYLVSMLTAAAPNRGAIATNQPDALASVPDVLRRRARRVLDVAAAHGDRRLVLGAWGCGVFGNDPAVVAAAFAAALRDRGGLDEVVFAVLDKQEGTPTYNAFAAVF